MLVECLYHSVTDVVCSVETCTASRCDSLRPAKVTRPDLIRSVQGSEGGLCTDRLGWGVRALRLSPAMWCADPCGRRRHAHTYERIRRASDSARRRQSS
jgi:hypothetical protein